MASEGMASETPRGADKTTLVFLHGSGDSARRWDPLIARLPDDNCLGLDLPGHGGLIDEPGPTELSVAGYAEYVAHELMRRGLTRVCVVGHSLGSAITLTLALEWSALTGRIILIGAGARLRVLPDLLEGARTDPDATRATLARLGHAPGHEQAAEQAIAELPPVAPGMLYRDLAACNAFDVMDELAHVTQPALIITGEQDRLTPPKYGEFLRERLPNATAVVVPEAGHYVMDEAPDAVAAAISSWLRTQNPVAPMP